MQKKVIVIGGGAAGCLAAWTAAENGAQVELWERNTRLGKKLAITGKGRCNLTNSGYLNDFIKNIPGNGNFLYSALNQLSNKDLMNYFEGWGVPLKIERGRRVFPKSDQAQDIVETLKDQLIIKNVKIYYNKRAKNFIFDKNSSEKNIIGVKTYKDEEVFADKIIIATGGASYPATGSTGDGYVLAKSAGHNIIDIQPSLVPLEAKEKWISELSGLALKNVAVKALVTNNNGKKNKNKLIDEGFGELLFTHFGLSGPVILTLSRKICAYWQRNPESKDIKISINLKPALDQKQLDQRLQRDLKKFSRKQYRNSLYELLPKSLIPVFIDLSGIDPDKHCNQIARQERRIMGNLLHNFTVTVNKARPLSEAVITQGGVDTKEIDPKTMASKICNNLLFAGEVIDIDGFTGGYNLQIAFSTGYVAGKSSVNL